jgi:hypothetical protein
MRRIDAIESFLIREDVKSRDERGQEPPCSRQSADRAAMSP